MLEQLSGPKEERSGFLSVKSLADIEQVDDSRKESPAFSWANWRFVEDSCFLNNCSFVVVVGAEPALVLLF